jgi:hypothetical protein
MKWRVQVRTRRQWDRYCLWLAVGGGNLAGIIWILPALSMALGAPLWPLTWHHGFMRLGNALLMYGVAALACAPLRRLFWCFVPPCLWLVWSVMDRIAVRNWPGLTHDLHHNVPAAGMSLIFGVLLALVTGKFGRGIEEEDAMPDTAVMGFDSQEGVWPPAPNYPPQPNGRKEDGPHGK